MSGNTTECERISVFEVVLSFISRPTLGRLSNSTSRKLKAHSSCVNALTFSSGEGRFLASGGDGMHTFKFD